MIKLLYLVLSIVFILLGIIGLVLPVIPQVPFLIIGFTFLAAASKRFKMYIKSTKLYKKHINRYISKVKFLRTIFEE